ncbi:MAG: PIN domain-containing protein [Thermoanaerobaculia bacterium]
MSFLLDTNVISEWVKPAPDPHVAQWLSKVDEDQVFLSVASLAEIRRGVELMDPGKRRARLMDWLTGHAWEDRGSTHLPISRSSIAGRSGHDGRREGEAADYPAEPREPAPKASRDPVLLK